MNDAMVGRYEYVLLVDERSVATAAIVTQLHGTLVSRGDGRWSLSVVDRTSAGDRWAEITAAIESLSHTSALWVGPDVDRRAIAERWRTSTADTVVFVDASELTGDDRATIVANIDTRMAPLVVRRRLWPVRDPTISRRRALALMAGGVGALALAACGRRSNASSASGKGSNSSAGAGATASTTSTTAAAGGTALRLTPEMTEGPYYLDLNLTRSDISEDRTGAPLALTLAVVDTTGRPISGAAVDIWHCDANGLYSGFVQASSGANGGGNNSATGGSPADDGTFLRGTQVAGADGKVTFQTIYPGWYRGRTVHIHVKVHAGGREVHTGQLFFDDTLTDRVFRATAPYSSRGTRDTRNANDGIFGGGGSSTVLDVQTAGSSYAATIPTVVRRS